MVADQVERRDERQHQHSEASREERQPSPGRVVTPAASAKPDEPLHEERRRYRCGEQHPRLEQPLPKQARRYIPAGGDPERTGDDDPKPELPPPARIRDRDKQIGRSGRCRRPVGPAHRTRRPGHQDRHACGIDNCSGAAIAYRAPEGESGPGTRGHRQRPHDQPIWTRPNHRAQLAAVRRSHRRARSRERPDHEQQSAEPDRPPPPAPAARPSRRAGIASPGRHHREQDPGRLRLHADLACRGTRLNVSRMAVLPFLQHRTTRNAPQ